MCVWTYTKLCLVHVSTVPSGGLTRDVCMDLHQVVFSKYCTIWGTNQGCVYRLTPSCV